MVDSCCNRLFRFKYFVNNDHNNVNDHDDDYHVDVLAFDDYNNHKV